MSKGEAHCAECVDVPRNLPAQWGLRPTILELALAYNCLYNSNMRYEWDPHKAEANRKKHGVSFADAISVLEDDFALTQEDSDAAGEQRYVTLGINAASTLLVVVYTYREPDIVRLISEWKANKAQRTQYEKRRR